MITDDYNKSLAQLDLVRGRKAKFVCINDDMKDAPEITRRALQAFFEASYPLPSQFELPSGASNPVLYIRELKEWLQANETRKKKEEGHLIIPPSAMPFNTSGNDTNHTTASSSAAASTLNATAVVYSGNNKTGSRNASTSSASPSSSTPPSLPPPPPLQNHFHTKSAATHASSSTPPFLWWVSVILTLSLAGAALGFAARACRVSRKNDK